MTEIKSSGAIKQESLHRYRPNITKNYNHNNDITMTVNVSSMRPYCSIPFTFDSLMEVLSTEPLEQNVYNPDGDPIKSGEYAVSTMVNKVKEYYIQGNKVTIILTSNKGWNWKIDFQTVPAGAASARLPFRSRRRGSKSVQRRRKLGSKSKSRKRSSKPRRR